MSNNEGNLKLFASLPMQQRTVPGTVCSLHLLPVRNKSAFKTYFQAINPCSKHSWQLIQWPGDNF